MKAIVFVSFVFVVTAREFSKIDHDTRVANALLTIQETNDVIDRFRTLVAEQQKTIENLQDEHDVRKKQVTNSSNSSANSSAVGFTAYMNQTITLHGSQIVVFDQVVTNVGNNYHPNNGKFVCAVSGLYGFSCTFASNGEHKNLNGMIMMDGKNIAQLHATLFGDDLGSQNAFVHCNQGQQTLYQIHCSHRVRQSVENASRAISNAELSFFVIHIHLCDGLTPCLPRILAN